MRRIWLLAFWLGAGAVAPAQESPAITLEDLVSSAEQWAQENLDADSLEALEGVDREQVRQVMLEVHRRFQGEYVVDLASLKDMAHTVLPLLESHEETVPYAVWLKTRLDYLEVADEFRLVIRPPRTQPDQPPQPLPNPSPQKEREAWVSKLSRRPWPAAAKSYVDQLKPVFSAKQVPPELVWLAEIESSFDPRARSPAGAVGMFQLMPATARRFGLKTTWPFDQRTQPEPSARAAAQYLHGLHARFKDWRLALAAYNAGEGTVQRLLTRHKAASFDGIATHLPAETQLYVPKVEATILRREGVKLADLRVPRPAAPR